MGIFLTENEGASMPVEKGDLSSGELLRPSEYLEGITKPGVLSEKITPGIFAELTNTHFEVLSRKTGDSNNSIYDMTWFLLAGIYSEEEEGQVLQSLLDDQNSDGTWGNLDFPQSAIIDSFSMLHLLAEKGIEIPNIEAVSNGIRNLFRGCLNYKGEDFVAFELIFSQQMRHLLKKEETAPLIEKFLKDIFTAPQIAETEEDKKLAEGIILYVGDKIGKGAWKLALSRMSGNLYDPKMSFSFALEILNYLDDLSDKELDLVMNMVQENGSIGYSPAATAGVKFLVEKRYGSEEQTLPAGYEDKLNRMAGYFQRVREDYDFEDVPNLHPIDTSGELWNLLSYMLPATWKDLSSNPEILEKLKEIYGRIEITDLGVAWAIGHTLYDLDDTSTTFELFHILQVLGLDISDLKPLGIDAISAFQEIDQRFFCYKYEGDPSFASILHLISALETALGNPNIDEEQRVSLVKILNTAVHQMTDYYVDGYGYSIEELVHDKWHASRYYGERSWLSNESMFLSAPAVIGKIAQMLVSSQGEDGGFGELRKSTLEETSYAIAGVYRLIQNIDSHSDLLERNEEYRKIALMREDLFKLLEKAQVFFERKLSEEGIKFDKLWISKNLYYAKFQIVSAILSAKYLLDSKIDIEGRSVAEPANGNVVTSELIGTNIPMRSMATMLGGIRECTGKTAKDLTDGEKFSTLWAVMIGVDNGAYRSANALMIAIDALAEKSINEKGGVKDLEWFMEQLEAIDSLEAAEKIISVVENRYLNEGKMSFSDSIAYTLAFMVKKASEKIGIGEEFNFFISKFKQGFARHNRAQMKEVELSSGEEISCRDPECIPDIMDDYTQKFKDTVGIQPIMALCLPYSEYFSEELVTEIEELGSIFAEMLFMASQVNVIPEEINMGFYAYAAQKGSPISDELRKEFYGEYYEDITNRTGNPFHKTIPMMKLQSEFAENYRGVFLTNYKKLIEQKLTEIEIRGGHTDVLRGLCSSLEGIAKKLSCGDIESVVDFLGLQAMYASIVKSLF
ncbi:hypothetical protein JW796_02895 [Candidatus Dojkabacteria bacterium]|nr:hypothetical protein [Candidatus Dojkabacteria bacterium]